MVEKIIPWWRKAINYAMSGIRSLLGSGRANGGEARNGTGQEEKPEIEVSVKQIFPPIEIIATEAMAKLSVPEVAVVQEAAGQVDDGVDEVAAPVVAEAAQPAPEEEIVLEEAHGENASGTEARIESVDAMPEMKPLPSSDAPSMAEARQAIHSRSESEADLVNESARETSAEVKAILQTVVEVESESFAAQAVLLEAMTVAEMDSEAFATAETVELAVEDEKPEVSAVEAEAEPSLGAEAPQFVDADAAQSVEAEAEPSPEAEAAPPVETVAADVPLASTDPVVEPVVEAAAEPSAEPSLEAETAPSAETVASVVPVTSTEPVAEPAAEAAAEPASAGADAAPASVVSSESKSEPQPVAVKSEAEQKTAARVAAAVKAREESADPSPFSVFVGQVYEGPLDLLLDLIRKQDIDIYDIPIAKITAQFLAYVNQLKAGDMDVAGEFIYTASLLIHIKSKMLLPRTTLGPDDTAEDPRRELVERLLEHERFKNAAQMLQQKQMLEAATWTNPGVREFREDAAAEPEIAADTTDLVRVFQEILERARSRPIINVEEDSVTVGQMIQFLARRLTMEDKPVALHKLLSHTRSERALIAMFLALLELVRLQAILLRQDRQFSEIFVKKNSGFETVMDQGLAGARDDWR